MLIISQINGNNYVSKILDVLKYISQAQMEYDKAIEGKNYIYLNTKNVIKDYGNAKEIDSITISSYSTQMLFETGLLYKNDFVDMLQEFNAVLLEINGFYPCNRDIYE